MFVPNEETKPMAHKVKAGKHLFLSKAEINMYLLYKYSHQTHKKNI